MLLHHPDVSSIDNDSEKMKDSLSGIMNKCFEESFQPIKDAQEYVVNATLRSCIYPTPKDQQTYRSVSRYFMMFRKYWLLCQTAISDRTSHHVTLRPNPLSTLVISLKNRIDVCIKGMTETGFDIDQDIWRDIEYLIEALLDWEVDEIIIGAEDLLNKLQSISLWLEETDIKLGCCLIGITPEEQTYIKYACQIISDYDRKAKISVKKVLDNVDKQAAIQKKSASIDPQKEKSMVTFPLPDGAKWEDLSIIFSDSHVVTVKHQGVYKRFTYSQMGMVCSKSGDPTKQWNLLWAFAESLGEISWYSKYATNYLKKQKQILSKHLRDFFQLEDDPIKWIRGKKTYRCRFTILLENVDDY